MMPGAEFIRESTNEPGLFDTLDQPALERVTLALVMAFASEAAAVLPQFADDDTIAPSVFQAGILKAHLLGAFAAIATIARGHHSTQQDVELVDGVVSFLREEVSRLRSAS